MPLLHRRALGPVLVALSLALAIPSLAQDPVPDSPPPPEIPAAAEVTPAPTPEPAAEPPAAEKSTSSPTRAATSAGNTPLREIVRQRNLKLPLPQGRIVIYKARRELQLFSGRSLLKTYRVALGNAPSGHKQKMGDGRTPEGEFFICTRNARNSDFHIFLGLSYPTLLDAARGVQQKLIKPQEMALIRSRLASRSAPPWRTRLGGWIGIHGGSDMPYAVRMRQKRGSDDWTAGCIALSNREIAELHAATAYGTPVTILP